MKTAKVGCVLMGLALAGAAGASHANWWWGDSSSDATDVNNWWENQYDTTAEVHFKASDVATYGGDVKSYTVDFKDNVVTGYWTTVSCDGAFSYDPIVWKATTGGFRSTEILYVGGNGEGSLDIQSGNYYIVGSSRNSNGIFVGQYANNGYGRLRVGTDATLETPYHFYVASDALNEGSVTNYGHMIIGGQLFLGQGNNATAQFVQNEGSLTVNKWLCVGSTEDRVFDALFKLNGGSVSNTANNITIGSSGASGAKAVLEVNGGELYTSGDIYVNERHYADCELRVNGGRVYANGKIYQNLKEQSNKSSIVTTGGELSCGSDLAAGYNGDSKLVVSGGVVRCGYWLTTSRYAKSDAVIRVYDGELSAGYRDGKVQSTDGVLDLCCTAGSSALYEQFGGVANFTYNGDAVRMGVTSGTKTDLRILGGTMNVTGKINLGYATQTTNTLTIATNALVSMGGISSVNATEDDTANNNLYLDGGVLQANATASIGGKFNIYVKAGGVTLDTTNYCVTVANDLKSGVAEGETDGGLVKIGKGILTLTGATTYNGTTEVREGVLAVNAGHAFTGGVKIGAMGAIAVAIDSTTLAVDDEITLFTTSALTFEDDADSIATSVFLTGNVIGYTLSSTTADGVTTVKATVTDVTNISSTRKVTSFIGGPGADDATATQYYVDQASAWSNGYPDDGKYDVAIFPGDAHMCIYATDKSVYNNKAAGDFVIRGGRVTVVRTNAAKWPNIGARHIAGNGTLCLQGVGLQSANTLVVDAGVTVDVGYPKLPSVAEKQDCWTDTSSETAPLTINGAVVATNGFIHFRGYTTINGPITVGPYASGTSGVDNNTSHLVFNGTVTVLDGATFAFGDHSSSVTFGASAKLVLKGTGAISGVTGIVFPTIVLGEGAAHLFSELNTSGGNLELDGGTLKMAYNQLEGTGTNLVLKAGQLALDMSGVSSVSEGTTATIPGVTLASGVALTDVTIVGSNSSFAWMASLNDDGTITLTAKSPDGINRWVGGASGSWKDAGNWQYGVPANGATAQIDNDATIYFDANKTVSNIVVNANVQFRKSSGDPTIYIREVNGTGTIGLYHAGFEANGLPGTIASTLTLRFDSTESDGSDSWLKGSSSSNPLLVYAPLTGAGYARIYDSTRFYGNNENFTGKMRKDDVDARFMTAVSGIPNASEFECYGTLWLWFDEGTITFPKTTMTASGNRGINVPAGAATSAKGITLVLGNNDGAVAMSGDHTYRVFVQNGTGWTDGCANFTLRKIGSGSFADYTDHTHTLALEGGTTTFNCNQTDGTTTITVTNATIATTENRTIGTVTFEEGACLALNTNALITVQNETLNVSNLTVTYTDEQESALAASDYAGATSFALLSCANSGTVSGSPKGTLDVGTAGQWQWQALVTNNALVFARKYVKPGLFIIIR